MGPGELRPDRGAGAITASHALQAPALPAHGAGLATLAGLLAAALALRLLALWLVEPQLGNDTTGFRGPSFVPLSYREAAMSLLAWDFSQDLGTRAPGYPAFMALNFRLFGVDNWQAIAAMQSLASLLLFGSAYWLWSQLYGPGRAALLATATAVLEPVIVLSERGVIAESLSVVLLVLALALLVHAARHAALWAAALCGLALAWLALTRPAFQLLVPLFLAYLALRLGPRRLRAAGVGAMALLALAASVPLLAWNAFNHARFGYFTPMTTQGFILTSHSEALLLAAPERYPQHADVIASLERHHRPPAMAIWLAYPEIMQGRGLSFIEASRLMQAISLEVFRDQPLAYARSVYRAFSRFWQARTMVPAAWEGGAAYTALYAMYAAAQSLGIALFFVVLAADLARPRRWLDPGVLERLLILGTVALVCLASTVPIAVENARYKIPLLPLMWGVVAASLAVNAPRIRALAAGWR